MAIKELIVSFAFFEGFWIYAQVNPLEEILLAFNPLLKGTEFEWYIDFAYVVLFILIPILQIIASYFWGGIIGLIALLFAFLGGIYIANIGVILLIIGIILGFYSFSSRDKITFTDIYDYICSLR